MNSELKSSVIFSDGVSDGSEYLNTGLVSQLSTSSSDLNVRLGAVLMRISLMALPLHKSVLAVGCWLYGHFTRILYYTPHPGM